MYCVKKVLNNNAVLAVDLRRKEEVIFLGKGVGFNKKVNQPFEDPKSVKKYHLKKETSKALQTSLSERSIQFIWRSPMILSVCPRKNSKLWIPIFCCRWPTISPFPLSV